MRGARTEDFHMNPATPNAGGGGGRNKGVGVGPWLVLYSSGMTEPAEKHTIMQRTGLPARDLRILDPLLSYPSTILGREKAIVISLEHIKAIITAQEVSLLGSMDPSVSPFAEDLQKRILCRYQATKPQDEENSKGKAHTRIDPSKGSEAGTSQLHGDHRSESKRAAKRSLKNQDGSKIIPFEFVALEACLESASSTLRHEALRLELEAHPVLEKLTTKINTLDLERVRQIKIRLVAITGRVQKFRDELERLLDDDEDLAEMYLTEKLAAAQKLEKSSTSSMIDVEELEMLLDAYFVQIDGTLNKLSTLREYVDDTEDYINIDQDDKQNQLLQAGVILTTCTLVISAFIAVAGVFGMNISIGLFNDEIAGPGNFAWVVVGCCLGCLFFGAGFIGWMKSKRLIQ